MQRLAIIIAATFWVAACTPSDDDNNVLQIDDDLAGVDAVEDMAIELPVLEGELVTPPTRESVEDVRISDGGEFLFIVQDDRWFAWLAKEQTVAIEFASWPDATRPEDGPPSVDVAFDDTYFWFLSEYEGGWSLAGVEHFLGNATPLFGQPIIIIDLGPIQKPRGIERYADRFVIPTSADPDGVAERIIAGEGVEISRRSLPGVPIFDRFDDDWLAMNEDGAFTLSLYDAADDSFRRQWSGDSAPLGFAGDRQVAYAIGADTVVQQPAGIEVANSASTQAPLMDVNSSIVAWTSTDGIRVYDGELRRIEADEVDSILVDEAYVWWSNSEGIFRAPIN